MRYGIVQGLLAASQEQLFVVASQLGFDGVELQMTDQPASDPLWSAQGRASVKARAAASNVATPAVMLGVLNKGGFANDDTALQDKAREMVRAGIAAATGIGANVVLVPFFFGAHPADEAAFARVVAAFRELSPEADRAGVTLTYEGELPAADIIRLIDATASPALRCYYDVGNAVWLGFDPIAEMRLLGKQRIAQIHFKEIKGEGLQSLNDVPLGEGRVPLLEAAHTIQELGYDGWVVLETRSKPDARAAAAQNLAALRAAFEAPRTV